MSARCEGHPDTNPLEARQPGAGVPGCRLKCDLEPHGRIFKVMARMHEANHTVAFSRVNGKRQLAEVSAAENDCTIQKSSTAKHLSKKYLGTPH